MKQKAPRTSSIRSASLLQYPIQRIRIEPGAYPYTGKGNKSVPLDPLTNTG